MKGLQIIIDIEQYRHKIISTDITCEYMLNKHDNSDMTPFSCPIYYDMMYEYKYSEDTLQHMNDYNHFKDEYHDKPECRHYDQCFAHQRLQEGQTNKFFSKSSLNVSFVQEQFCHKASFSSEDFFLKRDFNLGFIYFEIQFINFYF